MRKEDTILYLTEIIESNEYTQTLRKPQIAAVKEALEAVKATEEPKDRTEWLPFVDGGVTYVTCKVCNADFEYSEAKTFSFCPRCGRFAGE